MPITINGSVSPPTPLRIHLSASDYVQGATTWLDKSGNGKNATLLVGTAQKNQNGVVLDGSTAWTFPNVAVGNAWTVNVWFKGTATTKSCIVAQRASYPEQPVNILVGSSNPILEIGSFKPYVFSYILNLSLYKGANLPTEGLAVWKNYQATWDGANLKTYINGALFDTTPIESTSYDNTNAYIIGGHYLNGTPQYQGAILSHYQEGEIGELRIYNVALSSSEVTADYNQSASVFTGLVPVGPIGGGISNPLYLLPPSPDALNLTTYFNNNAPTTVESAAALINAALSSNAARADVVAAVLANGSAVAFTALVNDPRMMGTSVSIPPSFAGQLYSAFENQSFNRTLPLTVNFLDESGAVAPPVPNTNSKLAIDLLSVRTADFAVALTGCTGYGFIVKVMPGSQADVQYFVTPSNPQGTKVNVGDVLTIISDAGETRKFLVIDLDITVAEVTDKPVCFLGDAPVLTTNGYVRMDSVRVGDSVMTANGSFKVSKVFCETYLPGPDANPYVIPNGRFGAVGDLRISPRHRVSIDGRMVEARHLCLEQDNCESPITYYNVGVEGAGNMIVAGVEVESLIPLSTYRIPGELFETVLKMKYGGVLTPEMKENCQFHEDGSVEVPVM